MNTKKITKRFLDVLKKHNDWYCRQPDFDENYEPIKPEKFVNQLIYDNSEEIIKLFYSELLKQFRIFFKNNGRGQDDLYWINNEEVDDIFRNIVKILKNKINKEYFKERYE